MKKISRVDGGISAIVEEDPPKEISIDPSLTNDENFIWKGRRRRNLALILVSAVSQPGQMRKRPRPIRIKNISSQAIGREV